MSTIVSSMDRIRAAAAEGEQLLSVITATDDTAANLTQLKLDIAALKNPCYDAHALYSDLSARIEREQKEFEDLRDSRTKKLFGGSKYKEKLVKEENDVTELLEWQAKADKTRKELDVKLDDMKERRQKLEQMVEQRIQALNDLDNLYVSVFNGPSPGHDEEDKFEAQVKAAEEVNADFPYHHPFPGIVLILSRSSIPYRTAIAKWPRWLTTSQWLVHALPLRPGARQRLSKFPSPTSSISRLEPVSEPIATSTQQ